MLAVLSSYGGCWHAGRQMSHPLPLSSFSLLCCAAAVRCYVVAEAELQLVGWLCEFVGSAASVTACAAAPAVAAGLPACVA